ncbi:hypothetical protein PpBr36_05449 [Pyricularia pennisetigena]|uniref:hypothetical protein n=1 Tax=Pyricularia pennisetigena TaxID=1578925 RepID=UPI00114FA136|nr:hypothetical protein PpBr36_05449 [Pyricularia pennisetigena]TLS27477.1 hypothetical protein PpBr36_05449 [Pyricularia pennisetigena]
MPPGRRSFHPCTAASARAWRLLWGGESSKVGLFPHISTGAASSRLGWTSGAWFGGSKRRLNHDKTRQQSTYHPYASIISPAAYCNNTGAFQPVDSISATCDFLPEAFSRQTEFTMSAQSSAGIQTLLEAEREASKIVQKVRTKRVKEARDEAKKEIEAYKAEKESEYKAFESKHTQGNKQAEEEANKEAETQIKEIKEAGKKHQDKVIKDLLKAVFEPHPVPPTAA